MFHLRSKYIKREGGRQRERHLFAVDGGVSCAAAAAAVDALIARAATAADLACDGGAFVSIDKQTNNRKNCRQLLSGVNISNGGVATSAVISRRQAGTQAALPQSQLLLIIKRRQKQHECVCALCVRVCVCAPL